MTGGHELLMNKVRDTAKKVGGDYRIYTTFTKGDASNPLTHAEKVRFMRKQIPGLKVAKDKDVRNPFDMMQKLSDEGYKEVYLVLGGSRVGELKKGIAKYIPSKYKFDKFTVVSAGRRDPDAEGVTGISGTKVREMVKKNHKAKFRKAMPSATTKDVADALFKTLRKKAGLKEEVEQIDEVMTAAQKRQRSIMFKRLAPRIRRKKEIMRKRKKTPDQLRKMSYRAAKRAFRKRLLKGKNYYELGFSERIRIDDRISKIKKNRIEMVAKKMYPTIVKKERARQQSAVGPKAEARDYAAEYDKYHSKPEYRADRASRVQARRDAESAGRVSKGDGKDVHHVNGNARDNSSGNTRVVSKSANRSRDNNSKKYTRKEEHGAGDEGTKKLLKKYKKDTPGETVNEKVYKDSGLGKWFGQSAGGEAGWDRYNTKGERVGKCGDSKPGEGKPKCLSPEKARKLRAQGGKKAIGNAAKRKKAADPNQDRPGTGNKPINVSNRIKKEHSMKSFDQFKKSLEEKNVPTDPAKWAASKSAAKAKFDVYPSAYANAWASKNYKSKGGSWRKESFEYTTEAVRDTAVPPSPEMKKAIESGKMKVVKSAPSSLGGKSVFTVLQNPAAAGRKDQDQFVMAITSNPSRPGSLKLFSFHGSHPSAAGAMKMAKNRGLLESSQIDEISSDTLRKYVYKRRGQVQSDLNTGKHSPKTNKKAKGVVAALSRLDARKNNLEPKLKREDVKQVDELKRDTLGSYADKAQGDIEGIGNVLKAKGKQGPVSAKHRAELERELRNRVKGRKKAIRKKYTREAFEFEFPSEENAKSFMQQVSRNRLGSSTGTKDGKVRTEGPNQAGVGSPTRAHQQMAKLMKKFGGKLLRTDEGPRMKRVFKEDVEQVDELKVKTLRSYISKAQKDNTQRVIRMTDKPSHMKADKGEMRKLRKRQKGVANAKTDIAMRRIVGKDYRSRMEAKIGTMAYYYRQRKNRESPKDAYKGAKAQAGRTKTDSQSAMSVKQKKKDDKRSAAMAASLDRDYKKGFTREATMADRKVMKTRNLKPLEKKTTNISLVLPNTPAMKAKMKKIMGFSDKTKKDMSKLVSDRETRGKDQILYFRTASARKKFSKMLNAKSDWVGEEAQPKLNNPTRTSGGAKKFMVKVKDPSTGNVKTVRFGDPNMEIKRDDPKRRKAFRDRHGCDNPGPKTKAKYWSCRMWSKGQTVSDLD